MIHSKAEVGKLGLRRLRGRRNCFLAKWSFSHRSASPLINYKLDCATERLPGKTDRLWFLCRCNGAEINAPFSICDLSSWFARISLCEIITTPKKSFRLIWEIRTYLLYNPIYCTYVVVNKKYSSAEVLIRWLLARRNKHYIQENVTKLFVLKLDSLHREREGERVEPESFSSINLHHSFLSQDNKFFLWIPDNEPFSSGKYSLCEREPLPKRRKTNWAVAFLSSKHDPSVGTLLVQKSSRKVYTITHNGNLRC